MSKNDEYAVDMAVLLLRKMADKMEEEPDFAWQLLEEVKALRKQKTRQSKQSKKPDKSVEAGSESSKATNKSIQDTKQIRAKNKAGGSPVDLPDIYEVYSQGQDEGLRNCLEGYELDILKAIVAKNHLDPSGKVRKRKSIPNMINFIIETTRKRLSQGDAFKSTESGGQVP